MTGFIQAVIKNTRVITMQNKDAATATTANYLYDLVGGLLVAATNASTTQTIVGVANETISAGQALTQCPVIMPSENDVWLVGSTNNSDPLHNGQLMVLGANAYTVNNTGATDPAGIVKQVGVFGDPRDKKILVSFVI